MTRVHYRNLKANCNGFSKLTTQSSQAAQSTATTALVKGNKMKLSKPDIAVRNRNYHTATGNNMPCEITQCYLPPGRGNFPTFTPAEAGTRFSDPGGMQG